MKVWYKALRGSPAHQKTYRQNVTVKIGPPLVGEDGTKEENPFYFQALSPSLSSPGSFMLLSSGRIWMGTLPPAPGEGYFTINQWWEYNPQGDHFSGTLRDIRGFEIFNRIVTEDLIWPLPGGHTCLSDVTPGSSIDITLTGDRVTTSIIGTVYDAVHPQYCTAVIERFELTIEASRE